MALTPESVWNCHRRSPLRASSAWKRPSLRPTNTSPPAVVKRAAEAALVPLLPPHESVGREVHGREHAAAGDAGVRAAAAEPHALPLGMLEAMGIADGVADVVDAAHIEQVRGGIVRARRPVDGHLRPVDHRLVPERREDAPAVGQVEALRAQCRWTAARPHRPPDTVASPRCAGAAPGAPASPRYRGSACRSRGRGCRPSRSWRPAPAPCAARR